jgi:hypothetical protein
MISAIAIIGKETLFLQSFFAATSSTKGGAERLAIISFAIGSLFSLLEY